MITSFNLYAIKGSDFAKNLLLNGPIESGATIRGQIRKNYDSSYFMDLDVSIIESSVGLIHIELSGSKSSPLTTGKYFCDIIISGTTIVAINGELILTPNSNRNALTIGDIIESNISECGIDGLYTESSVGGSRVVIINNAGKIEYANSENPDHINKIIGITKFAANANEIIRIQDSGFFEDSSWNWVIGKRLYASTNGIMTQTIPSSGFIQEIGIAISIKKIIIDIKMLIVLEG
jgi:hypothetical protein